MWLRDADASLSVLLKLSVGESSIPPQRVPHVLIIVLCWLSWHHAVSLDSNPGPRRTAAWPSEHVE